jgi:hypothetical protein
MKIKSFLFLALFAFFSIGLSAQEKYDIAVVGYFYDTPKCHVYTSINGEKFEQVDIEREELTNKPWGTNMNPLIKQVNKLQSEGWEVVGGLNASGLPSASLFFYNLRKKR